MDNYVSRSLFLIHMRYISINDHWYQCSVWDWKSNYTNLKPANGSGYQIRDTSASAGDDFLVFCRYYRSREFISLISRSSMRSLRFRVDFRLEYRARLTHTRNVHNHENNLILGETLARSSAFRPPRVRSRNYPNSGRYAGARYCAPAGSRSFKSL